jgi:hypothetical protein
MSSVQLDDLTEFTTTPAEKSIRSISVLLSLGGETVTRSVKKNLRLQNKSLNG